MSDKKQIEEPLCIERYVLTLQHQYVIHEDHSVRTTNVEEPIKVMYVVSPFEQQQQMTRPQGVVINEMLERMRKYLLLKVGETGEYL